MGACFHSPAPVPLPPRGTANRIPDPTVWEASIPTSPHLSPWARPRALSPVHPTPVSLAAPPTNYGLYEQLKQRWLPPEAGLGKSTYTLSYPRPLLYALSRREHAIPVPPQRLQPIPRF